MFQFLPGDKAPKFSAQYSRQQAQYRAISAQLRQCTAASAEASLYRLRAYHDHYLDTRGDAGDAGKIYNIH